MPKALRGALEYALLYRVEVSQHIDWDPVLLRPVLHWEGHSIDVALVKWFRKFSPGIDFERIRSELFANILKEYEEEIDGAHCCCAFLCASVGADHFSPFAVCSLQNCVATASS